MPLSVWAQSASTNLIAGLFDDLTRVQAQVAVIGFAGDEIPAGTGRRVTAFHDHHHAPDVHAAVGADTMMEVQAVTYENLSCRLAGMSGQIDLIVTVDEWSRGEGFWSAASCALAPGGYAAVVVSTSDPRVHARVARDAADIGLGYIQHVVAVTNADLNHAVAAETDGGRNRPGTTLRRAHRDVFVFVKSEEHDNA